MSVIVVELFWWGGEAGTGGLLLLLDGEGGVRQLSLPPSVLLLLRLVLSQRYWTHGLIQKVPTAALSRELPTPPPLSAAATRA